MIPKIIHQTWKTDTVPVEFVDYQQKVIDLHPGWEYKLWTDEDNSQFVKENFPDFYQTFMEFPKNIMRADVIRYLIMYKVGGVYLDLDYEMIKPFDLLQYDLVLPYSRQLSYGDTYDGIGNCIFASSPGHKFWEYVIDDLKKDSDYDSTYKSLTNKPYVTKGTTLVEAITGPAFLTKILFSTQDKLHNYILPARVEFHPPSRENYENILASGKSYGIHHCTGTWRNKSYLTKVVSRIKALVSN